MKIIKELTEDQKETELIDLKEEELVVEEEEEMKLLQKLNLLLKNHNKLQPIDDQYLRY
jgi:hypothetical protein